MTFAIGRHLQELNIIVLHTRCVVDASCEPLICCIAEGSAAGQQRYASDTAQKLSMLLQ